MSEWLFITSSAIVGGLLVFLITNIIHKKKEVKTSAKIEKVEAGVMQINRDLANIQNVTIQAENFIISKPEEASKLIAQLNGLVYSTGSTAISMAEDLGLKVTESIKFSDSANGIIIKRNDEKDKDENK